MDMNSEGDEEDGDEEGDEEDGDEDDDDENNIEGQIVQPGVGMKEKNTKELEYGYDSTTIRMKKRRQKQVRVRCYVKLLMAVTRMKNSVPFSVGVYDSLSIGRSELRRRHRDI